MSSFLESKVYKQIYIKNQQPIYSLKNAPFINEGGSIFKKTSLFLEGIQLGSINIDRPGLIRFNKGTFEGYNGNKWINFDKKMKSLWSYDNSCIFVNNKVAIGKSNANKLLDIGGDVNIDNKLFVKGETVFSECLTLNENQGKNKKGMIRFYGNEFQGFNGEKWINFSNNNTELNTININELDMKSNTIKNLGEPLNETDAVSKSYVDSLIKKDIFYCDFFLENMKISFKEELKIKSLKTSKNKDIILFLGKDFLNSYRLKKCKDGNDDIITFEKKINVPSVFCVKKGKYKNTELKFFKVDDTISYVNLINGNSINESVNLDIQDNSISNQHLKPNIITDRELTNFSINNNNLNTGIIDNRLLSEKCISDTNLMDYCINENHLSNGLIKNFHLDKNIIKKDNLDLSIISSEHIEDSCITSLHLSDECVNKNHLTEKIVDSTILDNYIINNCHLNDYCIKSNNLNNDIISSEHIKEKSITINHLIENSITNEYIANDSITSEKIQDKSITSNILGDNIILNNHISRNIIKNENLTISCVKDYNLSNHIIKTDKIVDAAVTSAKIADNSITSSKIKSESINNNLLKTPYILIESDDLLTCNKKVNLGEKLKISVSPNYYIPKNLSSSIYFEKDILFGEEGCNKSFKNFFSTIFESKVVFNKSVKFNKKVEFNILDTYPNGYVITILCSINFEHKKWYKMDGSIIKIKNTEIKLPKLCNEYLNYFVKIN